MTEDKIEETKQKPAAGDIYEALLAVYKTIGYVQKGGQNKAQNYRYAGETDLIAALRPVMVENDIIFWPSGVERSHEVQVATTNQGEAFTKSTFNTKIIATLQYTFRHVPSNTEIKVQVIGEGVDSGDKASYKAMTGALKYALRQTFLIETGDEPEADIKTDKDAQPYGDAVFTNSAKRNKFCADTIALFESCGTIAELKECAASNKTKFAEMDMGSEHDVLAVVELRKRFAKEQARILAAEKAAKEGNAALDDEIIY